MAEDRQSMDNLNPIVTPEDASRIWVRCDGIEDPDRKWTLTNILAWLRSKFGTAIDSDVQTSLTDTTADRLMKVGAFGLGGTGRIVADDLNELVIPGLYACVSSTLHIPSGSTGSGSTVIVARYDNDSIGQIFIERTGNLYFRAKNIGTFTGWGQSLDSNNYPSDSAWTTTTSLANGWTGTVRYIKRAGWVTVSIESADPTSKTSDVAFTLPSAYHPSQILRLVLTNGDQGRIEPDGDIWLVTNNPCRVHVATYPVL